MTEKTEKREETFFQQQIKRLEQDLLQAAEWKYSAISLVVYDTALNGSKAVSLLEDRMTRRGQQIVHIAPESSNQNEIEEAITHSRSWDETVFFVMHLSFNADETIYQMISTRSDFIINNRIRVVYWVTEDDFVTYIAQMPENWVFEQRFYTLVNTANWESIWPRIGKRTWVTLKDKKAALELSENTPFEELLSLDIRDDFKGLIKRAQLLINFSLFYFHQKEIERAFIFAYKVVALAQFLKDETFLAKATLILILLQTKSGQGDFVYDLQKDIAKKLGRRSSSWVLLGSVYSSLFMFDNALDAYKNAIDLDRYNPSAFKGLGDVLLQQQHFAQAIDTFQQALDHQQNYPAAWYGLGKAYKAVGNYAKALECYQCSVEIDHRQPALWYEISEISEDKTAFLAIQRALDLQPETVEFWNALGNIQYRMKKHSDAIRSYYRVISIQKDFGWAYANMALIHTQANQQDKATLLLTKSTQVFRNDFDKAHAYYRLGKAHQQKGNFSDAAQAFHQARLLIDDSKILEHYLSSPGPLPFDLALPKDDDAAKQKANFAKTTTRSLEPKENTSIAKVLPKKQKISYAKALKKILATNQKAHSVAYWLELGAFYIRNRMYDLAEDAYCMAIELEPENGWTYYNLGKAYMFTGLYDAAVPLYEKSIELFTSKKDKARSWNQLGNAYRRLSEHSLAVAAYESARLLDPAKNSMLSRARTSLLSNCHAQY